MGSGGFWQRAEEDPDRTAVVDPDHTGHTAGEVLAGCNRLSHGLRELDLEVGDKVAVLLPNGVEHLQALLATGQCGWQLVPINYHLTGSEAAYIVDDSDAEVLITHERYAEAAVDALEEIDLDDDAVFAIGDVPGYRPFGELVEGQPDDRPDERTAGGLMNYTSGTTGRPKGVERPLSGLVPDQQAQLMGLLNSLFGIEGTEHVHLTCAPLYHTAVMQCTQSALHSGHRVVLMDDWTPEGTLERIERYGVTTTHMVPTMFHRLLNLDEEVRESYDVSSMTHAIHSAAPCPIPTKRAMLEWWGPVIYEYYAASEGGGTLATPEEWEEHPGTVGDAWPTSEIRILDEDGNELPPGEVGTIWMRMGDREFEYHDDEEKTEQAWNDAGFFTVGDAGYLDEDGFLYLQDRKQDMIISGGVNIYPAEIEACLIQHPDVLDVAVVGVPDEDWGEEVKAAVELTDDASPSDELAEDIIRFARDNIANYKAPRSVDFPDEFPRDPNGKVYKRELRDPYWEDRDSAIV